MGTSDADELRRLAKLAHARKAAEAQRLLDEREAAAALKRDRARLLQAQKAEAERFAKQREQARVELETKIAKLLQICMAAAIQKQSTVQVPYFPKDIAKRLEEYGLAASSEPSNEALEISDLERALNGLLSEFEAGLKNFNATFLEYLQSCGKYSEHDLRLIDEVDRLSLENFEQVFPSLLERVSNLADQYLSSIRQSIKLAETELAQARTELTACNNEIVLNQRRILNAGDSPSPVGLALIEQVMRAAQPTTEIHFNDEFHAYFSDTVDLALEGDEESARSRWHAMEKAFRDQKINSNIGQIAAFQACVQQRVSGFKKRHALTPQQIADLSAKNITLAGSVQTSLNTRLEAWETIVTARRSEEKALNNYAMKSQAEHWNKAAMSRWQSILTTKLRITNLQLSPSKVSRISWSGANSSAPDSPLESHFAAMLRFISGPRWDAMYAAIKEAAKRAATAGEVNCQITFFVAVDDSLELTIGKLKQVIPYISPAEFCTVLQERSGMKCKVLKSTKSQTGAIQLAW